jgi:uncharacterized repeat protein (TIGR04076 family)
MNPVRITVLRKEYYPDYAERYLTDGRETGACPLLNVGDTFLYEGGAEMPAGFCPWAWIDLYRGISALSAGGPVRPGTKRTASDPLLHRRDPPGRVSA